MTSSFQRGQGVEALGMARLEPYFTDTWGSGSWLPISGSQRAALLQPTMGDIFIYTSKKGLQSVEIKVEERFTGNLFLETWSNRNLEDEASWIIRGQSIGWMAKCRADYLLYFFLDTGDLFAMRFFNLLQWAHRPSKIDWSKGNRVHDFKEVMQRKGVQMNDTWGRLVPVQVIREEVEGVVHRVLPQKAAA